MKHAKLPWLKHDMEELTIVGKDHLAITSTDATKRTKETNLANKDLILKAVNSHYKLVELARLILEHTINPEINHIDLSVKAEQALKSVGGE